VGRVDRRAEKRGCAILRELAGWQHYLCFDAFVARWMVNDAPDAGYKLSPVLLLTLFFGPCGMLLYLALRPVLRRA